MLDLFGMGKKKEGEEAPASPAPEPGLETGTPAPPRGSHRLWAFLLVLDSVFVVVFAGAVAAKIYQHWRAPAPPARAARRVVKETPKPAEPSTPAPAASTAAAAPEPPKETPKEAAKAPSPEPAKEAPKAAAKSEPSPSGMRPPKPSLLAEAPKPRQTPTLAGPGAAPKAAAPAASAPAAGARPRAKAVQFSVRAPSARSVQLVGAFIVRGGRKEMEKRSDGSWTAEVYLHPGQYRYFFSVDKKKLLDPENPREERGASLLTVP